MLFSVNFLFGSLNINIITNEAKLKKRFCCTLF